MVFGLRSSDNENDAAASAKNQEASIEEAFQLSIARERVIKVFTTKVDRFYQRVGVIDCNPDS